MRRLILTTKSIFLSLFFVALFFVLFRDTLPSFIGGYEEQRFFLVFLLGFCSLLSFTFLVLFFERYVEKKITLLIPFFAFSSAFLFLSIPFTERQYVFVELGMYAFYFFSIAICGIVFRVFADLEKTAITLSYLIAASCLLYGLMSVNVYFFTLLNVDSDLSNFIPWGFVNIRYWSHIATWFLPLLPLATLFGPLEQHRLWRVGVALGAGLWWWIIFLSSARGSTVAIALGTLVVMVIVGRGAMPWLKLSIGYALLGGCLWLLLSVVVPSFVFDDVQIRGLKTDSSGRVPLFEEAWLMSLQNFPLGMGPQSWLTHDIISDAYRDSTKFGHPHNMYLMWAAEYGWILIAAMVILVGQAVKRFWSRSVIARAEGDADSLLLLAGFGASVAAALAHAGISAVFIAPGSMLVGLFVLIGFWALIQPQQAKNNTVNVSGQNSRYRKFFALALIGVLSIAWALWAREVWQYHQDMVEDRQETYLGPNLPRFWLHGNFPRE